MSTAVTGFLKICNLCIGCLKVFIYLQLHALVQRRTYALGIIYQPIFGGVWRSRKVGSNEECMNDLLKEIVF